MSGVVLQEGALMVCATTFSKKVEIGLLVSSFPAGCMCYTCKVWLLGHGGVPDAV
jgi:hypothetical protein